MARSADLPAAFQREAAAQFGFLRELGYGGPELETEQSEVLGPMVTLTWTAPRRQFVVTFFDEKPHPDVTAFLYRLPHDSVRDKLALDLFLEKYRPDLHARLAGGNSSPEEHIRSILAVYRAALQEEARPIAAGEKWQSGFFDDWTL